MSHHPSSSNAARLTHLESAVAHQQHDYDHLNQVVVEQAKLIEQLQRRLRRCEATLKEMVVEMPDRDNNDVADE